MLADVPPAAAGEVASVPTITIIGTEVLSDGTTASATTDPLDGGTGEFRYDAPTVAELPPPPGSPSLALPPAAPPPHASAATGSGRPKTRSTLSSEAVRRQEPSGDQRSARTTFPPAGRGVCRSNSE